MWLFIAFVAVVVFVIALIANGQRTAASDRRNALAARYPTDELYVSIVDGSAVGINFADEKIILGKPGSDGVYGFAQLAAVEVVENGATVSTTNRGSQLAGAAIGGLALGGVGALIGGLSGSRTTRHKIASVVLKVTVDDLHHPVHSITFLKTDGQGVEPDSLVAKPAREAAERVHAHLVNAMRRVQARTAASGKVVASGDRLTKLWDMRQAGALTEAEFENQKRLLLADQQPDGTLLAPEPAGRRYRVILVHPGASRGRFAKTMIAEVPEVLETKVAKLMANLPAVILANVGETRARSVHAALTAAGATVEIE